MAVTTKDGSYTRAIFVKRKRVDEPMDALMIDVPSQSKRYRGSMTSVDGRGMFTLAETMTEDPSLLDDLRTKDLHKRLAMINQESRASPKLASPASMSMSPTAPRAPVGPTREYKVLRAARAATSVTSPVAVPVADPDAAASASAPATKAVPIPVPGQPSAIITTTTTPTTTDTNEPGFVLYEAVPAEVAKVEGEVEAGSVSAPEMDEFQDLLTEYLRVNDISLDAPPPRKPVTSTVHAHAASGKKPVEEEEEEYVWDVFYQRANLSGDLSVWDGLANVGTLSGLPLADGDILADEEDSDSVKDEADEDSNEEDFYRNDYPDTESDESEAYESDGDHEWR